eukprot:4699446-Pyramimonas_sp.AAC.1
MVKCWPDSQDPARRSEKSCTFAPAGSLLHASPKLVFALLRAEWYDTTHNGCRARARRGMVMDDCSRLRAAAVACASLPPPLEDF